MLRRLLSAALLFLPLGCRDADAPTTAPDLPPALAGLPTAQLQFRQIDVGGDHACGTTLDSLAYCWGSNSVGQLGDGTRITPLKPVPVEGGRRWRHLTTGGAFSCGVTSNFEAWCWGWNLTGQLGDGTTTNRVHPVRVAGGHKFRQIRAGSQHACALTTDNVAWCWGLNMFGQVGDGSTAHRRPSPVRVSGTRTFVELSAGAHHTCGRTSAGKAWCWGRNAFGALGEGTDTNRNVPKAVLGGLAFRQLYAGGAHTCAVTTGNKPYCWGHNNEGQLGDGTTDPHFTPHAVAAGGRSFESVSAGNAYSCGVTLSHQGLCWGRNVDGQLGDGTTSSPRLFPTMIAGSATNWQFVRAGSNSTCGVALSRLGLCWGRNDLHQLGDGTDQPSPVPVGVARPN